LLIGAPAPGMERGKCLELQRSSEENAREQHAEHDEGDPEEGPVPFPEKEKGGERDPYDGERDQKHQAERDHGVRMEVRNPLRKLGGANQGLKLRRLPAGQRLNHGRVRIEAGGHHEARGEADSDHEETKQHAVAENVSDQKLYADQLFWFGWSRPEP